VWLSDLRTRGPFTLARGPFFWGSGKRQPRQTPLAPAEKGFSVLELGLVVTSSLIVVAVAVAAYRTHGVRAQVAASLAQAEPAQKLVVAAFENTGIPPADSAATGLDPTTRHLLGGTYIDFVEVRHGRIDLRFGERADPALAGRTLSLTPFETADQRVVWICGNEEPGVGLNPLGFAGGASQAERPTTTIEARFLPPVCR
jgi:hypothetical protein